MNITSIRFKAKNCLRNYVPGIRFLWHPPLHRALVPGYNMSRANAYFKRGQTITFKLLEYQQDRQKKVTFIKILTQ